ncbi:MAG: T9SS type A sorting domain-containing protein [Bacteroidia bacterium]|nr:T9SS type A sorting domain-containing protein [Bacteroidia bacterium]
MKFQLKILLLFLLALVQGTILQAQIQRTYHWYFGGNAGIDFSSGQAVADTNGQVNTWDGCATISDVNGNLLFYTDGSTVWNRNHQVMPNGTGLLGHWSSHQNSLIVPKPKDDNIYYIFTTDAQENNFQNGLRYSVVDITLDNGLGAVTDKNVLLVAPTHEQLAATFHSNCEDIWVITHKRDEEKFYAFLITDDGISTSPVISEIGNATQLLWGSYDFKISPNGEKIVSGNFWDWYNTGVIDTIELYDFDNTTGILSNRNTLTADTVNITLTFSPNNSKLYVTSEGATPNIPNNRIFQFELNSSDINSSKQLVYESNYTIYMYDARNTITNEIFFSNAGNSYLPVIRYPNLSGNACNFEDSIFSLNGRLCAASFPNFISAYFDTDSTSCFPTINMENYFIEPDANLYPNPVYNSEPVTIKTVNEKLIKIYLFTLTGKEVIFKTKTLQNEIKLDISGLRSGIYIVKLITDENTITKKIVIQND